MYETIDFLILFLEFNKVLAKKLNILIITRVILRALVSPIRAYCFYSYKGQF